MIKELILKNRSYRRFDADYKIEKEILTELVELARYSPSAKNMQALKFLLSNTATFNDKIFPNLAWAGYLKDWNGPSENERPTAYIIILGDKTISNDFYTDHGIASQSILLGAVEKGLGGCIIASVKREKLRQVLNIRNDYEILYVIALGKPTEKIVIDDVDKNGDIKYWRDKDGVHHVPKRKPDDLILDFKP